MTRAKAEAIANLELPGCRGCAQCGAEDDGKPHDYDGALLHLECSRFWRPAAALQPTHCTLRLPQAEQAGSRAVGDSLDDTGFITKPLASPLLLAGGVIRIRPAGPSKNASTAICKAAPPAERMAA
jgi:hypothetical protein